MLRSSKHGKFMHRARERATPMSFDLGDAPEGFPLQVAVGGRFIGEYRDGR